MMSYVIKIFSNAFDETLRKVKMFKIIIAHELQKTFKFFGMVETL